MTATGDTPARAGRLHADRAARDDDQPVVEVVNLSAGYGDRLVVRDITFKLWRGEILCLIGGSGCGKSTVIRAIAGLLRPRDGEVRVFGQNPHALSDLQRIELLRRVGMLFQNGALLGSLSVGENVGLALREHTELPAGVIDRLVDTKLALVGLGHAANMMPSELSGGMRKRASLSRAIAMDPELLLCDEPSAGLDPIVAAGLDETLRTLQRRLSMTMIVVTHELASIGLIADRVVMLSRTGTVLAQGTPDELRRSSIEEVRHFFAREPPREQQGNEGTLLEILGG